MKKTMQTLKKGCLISVAALFAVVLILASSVVYLECFHKTEVYCEASPRNNYTLHVYQVRAPGFPFGSVTTQIAVKESRGWMLDKKTFELCNDGTGVWIESILDVRWNDSSVEVEMRGADEKEPTVHTLDLS